MRPVNHYINRFLKFIKWPVALLMVLAVVPAFQVDFLLIQKTTTATVAFNFFLPFAATIVIFLIMPALSGSFFVIAEHELTHMLFAILTFHRPRGLEYNQDVGGSFSFSGEGNWLIALAPYFFPTFTIFLMIGMAVYQQFSTLPANFHLVLYGIFIGYHFIATCYEIHPKQTDFTVAGPFFTFCFLPGINLLTYGFIYAFIIKGAAGLSLYAQLLWQTSLQLIGHA